VESQAGGGDGEERDECYVLRVVCKAEGRERACLSAISVYMCFRMLDECRFSIAVHEGWELREVVEMFDSSDCLINWASSSLVLLSYSSHNRGTHPGQSANFIVPAPNSMLRRSR
jgi:hypothetical protein